MCRQIRRNRFNSSIQGRVEQSGVANRSHRPQPFVKKSSGSVIIAMMGYVRAALVGRWQQHTLAILRLSGGARVGWAWPNGSFWADCWGQ
jgi:hypothetical protein